MLCLILELWQYQFSAAKTELSTAAVVVSVALWLQIFFTISALLHLQSTALLRQSVLLL